MPENKYFNRFNPYVCPAQDCGNSKSIYKIKKWDEKRETNFPWVVEGLSIS